MSETPVHTHPARGEAVEARVAYAKAVAALAQADGEVSVEELSDLKKLCTDMDLDDAQTAAVLDFANEPDSRAVRDTLRALRLSNLRFTLVTDMVVLGLADGTYSLDERKQVRSVAGVMGIDEDQVVGIEQYVLGKAHADRDKQRRMDEIRALDVEDVPLSTLGELAARLAALGVPVGAILVASPLDELSYTAVQAGLSTLGLGMGPVPGVGIAFGMGMGTFFGVRWLARQAQQRTLVDDDEDEDSEATRA